MNRTQKGIVAFGALAVLATITVAPFEYSGQNEIARLVNGDGISERAKYTGFGTVYAAVWATPSTKEIESQLVLARDSVDTPVGWLEVREVHLATGRLGLWWAAIAIVVAVALALTSRSQETKRND